MSVKHLKPITLALGTHTSLKNIHSTQFVYQNLSTFYRYRLLGYCIHVFMYILQVCVENVCKLAGNVCEGHMQRCISIQQSAKRIM